MKFKIDENLPADVAEILEQSGYDAVTVLDQQLVGMGDLELVSLCCKEDRALITLDTDLRRHPDLSTARVPWSYCAAPLPPGQTPRP